MMAVSAAATLASATTTFDGGHLVNPATLTIKGSSTVLPIAAEEASSFPSWWNNLNGGNPSWGANNITSPISLEGLGSGTAIPNLSNSSADIGEMSRPPQSTSAEYGDANMVNMQTWAVAIDSVSIVISPDMASWFPQNLTTLQVCSIFAATPKNELGQTASTFSTWNDFFTFWGLSTAGVPTAALSEPISRAMRDPTSGTADCFNNYFGAPNQNSFLLKNSAGIVTGYDPTKTASYIPCTENINIKDTVQAGNIGSLSDCIGFISLGYALSFSMNQINIAFNVAHLPQSTFQYNSSWGTNGFTWGPAVQPTKADVIYGYSGIKGVAATGQYQAWRWLWEVIPNQIPKTGPTLEAGVWIAYMKMYNTTNGGASDFVNDQNYIEMSRADLSGGTPIDSNLAAYTPLSGQTQHIPDGKVTGTDFIYFCDAYIHYYLSSGAVYNPMADINANGKVDGTDFIQWSGAYIYYFTNYNPTH